MSWSLVAAATAQTDVLDCICAVDAGELVICDIEVRHLFSYPYMKHLREGLHDFIHALLADQIELLPILRGSHVIFIFEKLLVSFQKQNFKKCLQYTF
jgi:hypothetical protein